MSFEAVLHQLFRHLLYRPIQCLYFGSRQGPAQSACIIFSLRIVLLLLPTALDIFQFNTTCATDFPLSTAILRNSCKIGVMMGKNFEVDLSRREIIILNPILICEQTKC